MVDASHAELVKPIRGPAHRVGCVCCHMTSCLQPAGAQGQRHRSQPRYVYPSHGWTDGRAGSWKQWDWPQSHASLKRGGFSFVALQASLLGLSFPSGQWRVDSVLAVRVHCCSSTRSGCQIVAQRERQIFSPWDVDVPFSPRTDAV